MKREGASGRKGPPIPNLRARWRGAVSLMHWSLPSGKNANSNGGLDEPQLQFGRFEKYKNVLFGQCIEPRFPRCPVPSLCQYTDCIIPSPILSFILKQKHLEININRCFSVHFDKYKNYFCQQMHCLLKHKMLQFVS